MNIYIHEDSRKEKERRAKRFQRIGMACIIISFLLSFGTLAGSNTLLILLAYPFLLVGFPLWTMGRSQLRRLDSAPRADLLLNNELKGLNNKYSLHHNLRSGEAWIDHLLITPVGLIVMDSNDAVGPVSCRGTAKGDRWRSQTNLLDRLTGLKPPVGNPTQDLDASTAAARVLLAKIGKPDAPVKGLVLFTRNPEVEIVSCCYNGVPLNEAKQSVQDLQLAMGGDREEGLNVSRMLTSDDRRRLNNMLAPETTTVSAKALAAKR